MAPPARGRARGEGGSVRGTFVLVALVVAVPFLLLVGYLAWGQIAGAHRRGQAEALQRATAAAAVTERAVTARLDALLAMAGGLAAGGGGPAAVESQGRRVRQRFPDLERILYVDELGAVVAAVPDAGEGGRRGLADQDWFKRAATSTEPFASGARAAGPDVVVGLYAPARAAEGQLRGVVAGDLSLRRLQDALAELRPAGGGVLELVSEEGLILARQPPLFLLREVASGFGDVIRHQGGTTELPFEDGETRLVGAAPVRSAGWLLVVGVSPAEVGGDSRRRAGLAVALALVLAVGAVAGAATLGRRQARAMERLGGSMRRLASGDIPATLPLTIGGEVGALTESFNRMLGWLHSRFREYEAVTQVADEAGAAGAANPSIDGILPGLLRKVVGGMGAEAGVVLLRENNELVAKAAVGFPGIPTEGVRLRRGQGLGWAVMAERSTVVIADVENDYRVEEPYLKAATLKSAVGVPIAVGDEVIGAVLVAYRASRALAGPEIQRLEAMARRTAQAIEHARAFDAVRQSTAGLEAQVAEQLEALQKASREQVEVRRQAQEASRKAQEAGRKAQELEQAMKAQAERPPEVREVIVEKEVFRYAGVSDEQAAHLREEMQKTVSEELRAPLSALLDLPRFLVEGLNQPLGQDEHRELEILRDRGEEILELIDSLVILTGLAAGQVKVTRAPFDLPGLVHRVVRALQPRAATKGNRIEADIKLHVGQVVSDAKRVEQVLTNLLINAIKYTEVGEIKVTCYLRDADVVIVVADDGAGFTPDEVNQIFTPFLQVGPRDGRRLSGTGLTLTVCERLTAALGGRIRVESEVDRGTWFTVTLPGDTA